MWCYRRLLRGSASCGMIGWVLLFCRQRCGLDIGRNDPVVSHDGFFFLQGYPTCGAAYWFRGCYCRGSTRSRTTTWQCRFKRGNMVVCKRHMSRRRRVAPACMHLVFVGRYVNACASAGTNGVITLYSWMVTRILAAAPHLLRIAASPDWRAEEHRSAVLRSVARRAALAAANCFAGYVRRPRYQRGGGGGSAGGSTTVRLEIKLKVRRRFT